MNLSYAHGTANVPLIGETIGDFLDEVARKVPNNEALVSVFENRRITYTQFVDEVNRLARALLALGLEKGERVGMWSTNNTAWVLTQFATAKIGAILVTINPAYRTYELDFALRQSECNVLISAERFKDDEYLPMLQELVPELSSRKANENISSARFPHLREIIFLGEFPQKGMLSWTDLMTLADRMGIVELAQRQSSLDFDDVINIQYTSGTTGFPKGAMLSHHNLLNNR